MNQNRMVLGTTLQKMCIFGHNFILTRIIIQLRNPQALHCQYVLHRLIMKTLKKILVLIHRHALKIPADSVKKVRHLYSYNIKMIWELSPVLVQNYCKSVYIQMETKAWLIWYH